MQVGCRLGASICKLPSPKSSVQHGLLLRIFFFENDEEGPSTLTIHPINPYEETQPNVDRFAGATAAILCLPAAFGFPRIDICCAGIELWLDAHLVKLREIKIANPKAVFAVKDFQICDCRNDLEWYRFGKDNQSESLLELYDLLTSMNDPEFQFYRPQFCRQCRTVGEYFCDDAYQAQRRKVLHCEGCNTQLPGVYGSCSRCRNLASCRGKFQNGCEKCICLSCLEHAERDT